MKTRDIALMGFFIALVTAGAFIRIPLPFLSVTFQMLFALLAGIILGPVKGAAAMAVYMAAGLAGLPVFSLGGGPGYVLQPSFGFIIGFLPGAYAAGFAYNRLSRTGGYLRILAAYMIGAASVYFIGIAYMYVILTFYLQKPGTALAGTIISMLPYMAKDIVLGLAASFLGRFIPLMKKEASS
ncbi:MAG: biotin transporter BioY [Clostridia bacterium]